MEKSDVGTRLKRFMQKRPYIIFIMPSLALLIFLTVYPLAYGLKLSFLRHNLMKGWLNEFIFFGNYTKLIGDENFLVATRNTFVFVGSTVALTMGLGLFLALVLSIEFRGETPIRTLYLLPMMITPIVIGLTWGIMLDSHFGVINHILVSLGLLKFPLPWTSQISTALFSVIMVSTWGGTPFVILILVSGLRSLPPNLYEAATIDGASKLQSFWYLTLPLLKPFLLVALIFRIVQAFRVFDLIVALTYGGPANATESLTLFIYRQSFQYWRMGYGAASSWLLLGIIALISIPFFRILYKKVQE